MTDTSSYLDHLPQVFHDTSPEGTAFLGRFLKIFEALLSGRDDAVLPSGPVRGLEDLVAAYDLFVDPAEVPAAPDPADPARLIAPFLDDLAAWVGLTFDQNWDLARKREWLLRIVSLYKKRGTAAGLDEYLKVFIGDQARIEELPGGMVLGKTADDQELIDDSTTLGDTTFLAGGPAYYFRVRINYAFPPEPFDIADWRNIQQGTRRIVDREKPAHTYYDLDARTPGFILAERSTLSTDTLLWADVTPF